MTRCTVARGRRHVAICDLVHDAICDLVHVAVCDLVYVAMLPSACFYM